MASDWYAVLGLSSGASHDEIREAIERRSRQATALANTSPERSQSMREQIREMKRDLLPGAGEHSGAGDPHSVHVEPDAAGTASWSHDVPLTTASDPDGLATTPPSGTSGESVPDPEVGARVDEPTATSDTTSLADVENLWPGELADGSRRRLIATGIGLVAALAIGVAVIVASMSGGADHPASQPVVAAPSSVPVQQTTQASSPTPTDPPSTSPATDDPSPNARPSDNIGDIVLTSQDVTAACEDVNAPLPDPDDDASAIADVDWDGEVERILSNGIVIGSCRAGGAGVRDRTVAIVARTHQILWSRVTAAADPGVDENLLGGGGLANVYLLTTTHHPADGLADEYWTRTLAAIDVRTGQTAWVKPIEANYRTSDSAGGTVEEQHSVDGKHPTALVEINGWTALDASTGTELWSRPELDPDRDLALTDYGEGVYFDSDDEGNTVVVASDLATQKVLWRTNAGQDGLNQDAGQVVGRTLWYASGQGYAAFDVFTGTRRAAGSIPDTFSHALVTPAYTVAQVGSELELFRTGNWSKPIWTQPSDDVEPQVVTSRAVLVHASAGEQLLDASDGSILSSVDFSSVEQDDVSGGLLDTNNGVVEVGR